MRRKSCERVPAAPHRGRLKSVVGGEATQHYLQQFRDVIIIADIAVRDTDIAGRACGQRVMAVSKLSSTADARSRMTPPGAANRKSYLRDSDLPRGGSQLSHDGTTHRTSDRE